MHAHSRKGETALSTHQTHGEVLLIGGASGVGKTSVAQELGLRLGRSWLYVDDVRLAFQRSHLTLPEKTEALYFFEETSALWSLPPECLRDGRIGVGGSVVTKPFLPWNAPSNTMLTWMMIREGPSTTGGILWGPGPLLSFSWLLSLNIRADVQSVMVLLQRSSLL